MQVFAASWFITSHKSFAGGAKPKPWQNSNCLTHFCWYKMRFWEKSLESKIYALPLAKWKLASFETRSRLASSCIIPFSHSRPICQPRKLPLYYFSSCRWTRLLQRDLWGQSIQMRQRTMHSQHMEMRWGKWLWRCLWWGGFLCRKDLRLFPGILFSILNA